MYVFYISAAKVLTVYPNRTAVGIEINTAAAGHPSSLNDTVEFFAISDAPSVRLRNPSSIIVTIFLSLSLIQITSFF